MDRNFDLEFYDTDTGLGSSEVLYTARGSQGQGVSSKVVEDFAINPANIDELFLTSAYNFGPQNIFWK